MSMTPSNDIPEKSEARLFGLQHTFIIGLLVSLPVLILLSLYFSVGDRGSAALEAARAAQADGDYSSMVDSYRQAVGWYRPWDETSLIAAQELFDYALALKEPEARADALWSLRRGLFGSRNVLVRLAGSKRADLLEQVDRELAQIILPNEDGKAFKLLKNYEPSFRFLVLAQLLFWGWIVSVVSVLWVGFTAEGAIVLDRRSLFLGGLAVVCFAGWLLALSQV